MNLAYAEITLAIACLFRRFEFTLIDTDRSDVDTYRDEIGPVPKPDTKGVRVVVRTVKQQSEDTSSAVS